MAEDDREGRLDALLAGFLEAAEGGLEPDRRALLTSHPEFFDELSDFLADRDALETLAAPLREASRDFDDEEDAALGQLDPSEIPDHLGRLGPYEIVDWLGRGGMGVVFKGFDPTLNRYAAIKVLAPQWAADPGARRRFTREAQSAASISHPHVVAIHAVGEWKGRPYLVMEYVPGPSLQERLDEDGPPPLTEALAIAMQVASALARAHEQGLIHRDVKPGNILLEGDLPRAKLGDFGLARAVDDCTLTQQGTLAGTPQYMAPEQARGDPLDARADLFALGGVLHALCTGEPPFRGGSTPEVLRRVCDDEAPSPRAINPEVPPWLVALIRRLMAKDPAHRFESAAEVADLLARHLARLRDPSLPPVEGPEPGPARIRRHARTAAAALTAGLVAWAAVDLFQPPDAPPPGPGSREPVAVDVALPRHPADSRTDLLAHPDPERLRSTFRRDFRGPHPDLSGLTFPTKPGLDVPPRPDGRGLVLTVPRGLAEGVGVATSFRVAGDFEVTAGYEVPPGPSDGMAASGFGPTLTIRPIGTRDVFAAVARLDRGDLAVFALTHGTVAPDGRRRILGRWPPAGQRAGRFRLVRVGTTLHSLVADGESGPFRDLFRAEFGRDEVTVGLAIDTGGAPGGASMTLHSLEIRAEALPGGPGG